MGDYDAVMAIAAFFVFSYLSLVAGGGASVLFPEMEGERPPQIFPSETDIGYTTLDLEADMFSSENITFVDSSNLQDPDYDTEKVAILSEGADSGYIIYNTPGAKTITTLTQKDCGGFLSSSRMSLTAQGVSGSVGLCAETVVKNYFDNQDINAVNVSFESSDQGSGEPQLYQLRWSKYSESGDLGGGILGVIQQAGYITGFPLRLWDYIEHFPFYINLFYGLILTYMLIAIVRGLG